MCSVISPSSGTSFAEVVPQRGTAPVRLGTRDGNGFLVGGLDEVAIYPRVLSPEEVRQHYAAGTGLRNPSLERAERRRSPAIIGR